MKKTVLLQAAAAAVHGVSLLTSQQAEAATVVVDTFDQGGFNIEFPNVAPTFEQVNLPFGDRRLSAYHLHYATAQHHSRRLDPIAGNLSFSISGTASNVDFPLGMELIYTSIELRSVGSGTEFILGFSQLHGAGNLYVVTGVPDSTRSVARLALDGAGEYRYPTRHGRGGIEPATGVLQHSELCL